MGRKVCQAQEDDWWVCCVWGNVRKADFLPDPSPYILKDEDAEKKGGFVLADSIARSRELHGEQGGLFAGKLFHIVSTLKGSFGFD